MKRPLVVITAGFVLGDGACPVFAGMAVYQNLFRFALECCFDQCLLPGVFAYV